MISEILGDHEGCVACGNKNPFALGLEFHDAGNGVIKCSFAGNKHLQGYEGMLHGGVISTLLDSTMAHCLLAQDIKAMTANLQVRFLHAIPCNSKMTIKAWVTCAVSTLYELKSELEVDGKTMAKAKAKFMQR